MPFQRLTNNHNPTDALATLDKVALAQIEIKNIAPLPQLTPASVGICLLPDITGQQASVFRLASEILEANKAKINCKFLRMAKEPEAETILNTLDSDAAYIRCGTKFWYANRITDEFVLIQDFSTAKMHSIDALMGNKELLTDQDLLKVTEITGHLHENGPPVSIYVDPNILNGQYLDGTLSIADEATAIKNNLLAKFPNGPFVLVAYSYSSLLAVEIMQELTRKGLACFIYIIDAPSPELSKKKLTTKEDQYDHALVDIVNYTAELCSLKPVANLKPEIEAEFNKLSPQEIIEKMLGQVLENNPYSYEKNKKVFTTLVKFEKLRIDKMARYDNNIDKMAKYDNNFEKLIPGSIRAVITKKTAKKYGDDFCGWLGYATDIEVMVMGQKMVDGQYVPDPSIDSNYILGKDHQDIMRDSRALKILANDINNFVSSKLTDDYLQNYYLRNTLKQLFRLTRNDKELGTDVINFASKIEAEAKRRTPPNTPHGDTSPPQIATPPCNTPAPVTRWPREMGSTTASMLTAMKAASTNDLFDASTNSNTPQETNIKRNPEYNTNVASDLANNASPKIIESPSSNDQPEENQRGLRR